MMKMAKSYDFGLLIKYGWNPVSFKEIQFANSYEFYLKRFQPLHIPSVIHTNIELDLPLVFLIGSPIHNMMGKAK